MNFKKCAHCESENPETEVYCLECGEKLEPDKTLKRPPSQVAGALAESAPPEPPTAVSKPPAEPAASEPPSPELAPAVPEASLLPPRAAPSGLLIEKVETEAPPKSAQAAPPTPPPATKVAASREPVPTRQDRARADIKGRQPSRFSAIPPKVLRTGLIAAGVLVLAVAVWRTVSGPSRRVEQAAVPETIAVAVNPFAGAGAALDRGYFGEGLAEALADGLNRLPRLRLTGATPEMSAGRGEVASSQAARTHAAAYVLTGTFETKGDRLLMTARLVKAADGSQVWEAQVDRPAGDIFASLQEIASGLVQALGVAAPAGGMESLFRARAMVPEACDLYFQGRSLVRRGGKSNLEKAVELLEQAAIKDASWAGTYATLGNAYANLGSESLWAPGKAFPAARRAVLKAMELEPGLAEARLALAILKWRSEWDFAAAEQEFREALRSDPGRTEIRRSFALFLSTLGRHEEAQSEIRAALALDPDSPRIAAGLGMVLYFARLYDQAAVELENARQTGPALVDPCLGLGLLNIQTKDFGQSLVMFQQAAALGGDPMEVSLRAGAALAHLGQRQDVGRILTEALQASRRTYVSSASLATVYAALLEADQAQACLDKALADRDASLVFLKVSPLFDALRGEGWFAGLLEKTGF